MGLEELRLLGPERLKRELEQRGLKQGGSLEERAARLFAVRKLSPSHYPRKLLASQKKKKQSI